VRFVFPSTFASLAPAEETAIVPTSAAHSAAKAIAWRARRLRPVVDWIVPVIHPHRQPPAVAGQALRCERID
jgi:hypothetical protein